MTLELALDGLKGVVAGDLVDIGEIVRGGFAGIGTSVHGRDCSGPSDSSNRCATRFVLARDHAVSDARPSTSTAAPQAVITHQMACVAVVKSVPRAWLMATIVPETATPMAAPTWRLVEAMAAATPAWDNGIPATALLEIAGFTMPRPTPNSA